MILLLQYHNAMTTLQSESKAGPQYSRPSSWYPVVGSSIFGMMLAGILSGGFIAFISLVVFFPLMFIVAGFYAMVIMPKIAAAQ